ncbi:MAG TPA: c-type cytochrome [Polyangiaceae bacterium]|nr:c-type cytochrome [Polyangiaceae bacterium]
MNVASSKPRFAPARRLGSLVALFTLTACGAHHAPENDVARGQALFESKELSPSGTNLFTCATCHDPTPNAAAVVRKPGAPLAGATLRPSFWGGQEDDLLRAIDDCRTEFMLANTPLDPTSADAEALYDYLASLEPGDATAQPFTVVRDVADVPRGDVAHGYLVYAQTCGQCHGSIHDGDGRLGDIVPVLPDDTLAVHAPPAYSPRTQRLVFIEKTRHGVFLDYGGEMPPFSLEVLPDADLSDLLEALGVLGQ